MYIRPKFYSVWSHMKDRCLNPKNSKYKDYGGRGINVCDRWLKYENFEDDMYDEYGYSIEILPEGQRNTTATLDRIDNNKGYFKENCRWTSQKVQCNNRRKRVWKNKMSIEEKIEKRRAYQRYWWNNLRKPKSIAK